MGSPSISPRSTLVDFSDSFYQYVRSRILAANPNRLFGGIASAQDWPLKEAQIGAFYLLTSTYNANRASEGPGSNSVSSPLYGETLQWAWQLTGNDIAQNSLSNNRGDRYRLNAQMMQEMLQGLYPGFCEKKQWTIDDDGNLVSTSYVPKEMIWWTKPKFLDRIDRTTGILFGSAMIVLTSFAPTITG